MEINWFTFVAQIINFMILIFLLQRFLYEPITKVMNQRKNKIKGQLLNAEEQCIKAEEQENKYITLTEELEAKREEFLNQAKTEAQEEKTRLLKGFKLEVEETKNRWEMSLKQEQEQFFKTLHNQTGKELFDIIKKALKDLGNSKLESQIIETFLGNLETIDEQKKVKLIEDLQKNQEPIIIQTNFELLEEEKQNIIQKLQHFLTLPVAIEFEIYQDLLWGINLIIAGEELSWNLDSYLHNLEQNLKTALDF
jgi:F-type H+-transporting ATPase subunit b